ncbi:hypothetical protein J7T55_013067 [Diaporthe amygdali]|uniref:uncharacterized protein n=1 Tax=Phomopsis amygdali TaxID=1214568 RepID=UPI0022FED908|nr:uncharacterized protein J7T55_013067 [Diaporthe amygdali]KAJ0118812.1 hypothetical protein J7T55_013067 [Diaporthe amygdali]
MGANSQSGGEKGRSLQEACHRGVPSGIKGMLENKADEDQFEKKFTSVFDKVQEQGRQIAAILEWTRDLR